MWTFAIALTVVALLTASGARFLWRWRQAGRLERDRSVWDRTFEAKGGIRRDAQKYDQAKAMAGWKRAKRQTPTGRVLKASPQRKAGRRRGSEAAVVSMDSRRRAGGGK